MSSSGANAPAAADTSKLASLDINLSACCASNIWIQQILADRPYGSLDDLTAHSDAVIAKLPWTEILAAVDAHPRLGRPPAAAGREANWSRKEQSGLADIAGERAQQLLEGNEAYEKHFGWRFLACATGLGVDDVLRSLGDRLHNDGPTEQAVVRDQLAAIVRLRLAKALAL